MGRLLDRIDSPTDLLPLTPGQLEALSAEIRAELIEKVPVTGGHLASNLGVVELSIALHRVFKSPEDKIVWDVGHQSYVHKLLTGRRAAFSTLRQYGGLSGYTERAESPHDPFGAGHASTSISAALGIALARDLKKEKYQAVAVIGDGAFAGGMAFEALNHAGHMGTKVIIILNDNGMAISPSVGGLSQFFNLVRLNRRYELAKKKASKQVASMPFGGTALAFTKEVKTRLKRAVLPAAFWEEFGLVYVGPVDGHNIADLESALTRARDYEDRPTLIHVITKKGKAYAPAEEDSVKFHGLPPNGSGAKKKVAPSYSEVFGRTALRLLEEDEKVVAITAAMLEGTGLATVALQFPRRVFDVGICEQHAVTMAAGMATQGVKPIVAIYSTFLQRAYDQIIHDVCIQELPVVFAIDRAGIVGDDGKTHQGAFDISYLRLIPNMVVAVPKDEDELQHMIFTAVKGSQPMSVRYPRGSGRGVPLKPEFERLPIGKGEKLRDGRDIAIIAVGPVVYDALKAAETLSADGVECSVVNARFVKPLDSDLIFKVASGTKRLITVEENAVAGGFGSAVLQLLEGQPAQGVRVECIGLPDRFVEQGPPERLRSLFDLTADGIVRRAKEAFPELFERALARQERKGQG